MRIIKRLAEMASRIFPRSRSRAYARQILRAVETRAEFDKANGYR